MELTNKVVGIWNYKMEKEVKKVKGLPKVGRRGKGK